MIANSRYIQDILNRSIYTAEKSIAKFPAPNYTLTKIAEEAGEVVKAGVHYAENRDYSWNDIEDEVVQTIGACIRLLVEGDAVHGIEPVHKESDH